jgi:hypothetical protein
LKFGQFQDSGKRVCNQVLDIRGQAVKNFMRVLLIPLVVACVANITHAAEKPNVVLVFMDNFGWGELGCYGGGVLRGAATPRIDKLAAETFR